MKKTKTKIRRVISDIKHIRFSDFWNWVCFEKKSNLQRAEWSAMLMLLLVVPFFYLDKLTPPVKEFPLFSPGYYNNVQSFVRNLIMWIIPAIISTQYYFICRHRWGIFLGILSANYWWMSLCVVGWGAGLIKEGEQLYMLPVTLIWIRRLYKRRARWRKQAYKEKKQKREWTREDYFIGTAMLLAVLFTHICLLFPKTENFYSFHSGYFHNIQSFVYYLGLFLSNIIWLIIWFFDQDNRWLYVYIAWPLLMFTFKLVGMIAIEIGITTEVSQGYYYVLSPTILVTYILYRIRKSLYIRTHRKDIKRMMPLRPERKLKWECLVYRKHSCLINWDNPGFWRNIIMGVLLLSSWFAIRSDLSDSIYTQFILNKWRSGDNPSETSTISNVMSQTLFITAFYLWLRSCPWTWMRPYIAMALMMCCFTLLIDLRMNPYEDSGYYIAVVGVIFGGQIWQKREYFLSEAFYYGEPQRKDYSAQWSVVDAREKLYLRKYERRQRWVQERLEKLEKDKEQDRRKTLQVRHPDESFLWWRKLMREQYEKEKQKIMGYDIKMSERHPKELENFRKLKRKLIRIVS